MRAAALALVLIVGAAVVLWFGNTLNSWVLGGLIGGLAALLLSIPISLTLFSFMSRRHDEQLRAVEQEEISPAQPYEYVEHADADAEVCEGETYLLPVQAEWHEEPNRRRIPTARQLPAPAYPRLPAAGQGYTSASANPMLPQRSLNNVPRQQPKTSSIARGKDTPAQRSTPERRIYYPGFPGYQGNSSRGLQQTAALHAARQEALRQRDGVEEVSPIPTTQFKRLPPPRSPNYPTEQIARPVQPRPSRQLPQQPPYQQRPPRRTVDALPMQPGRPDAQRQINEPRTEDINDGRYPRTGPVRQQTDQVTRRPNLGGYTSNSERATGSIKNPLVRRAPYTYEDDPLRQQLSQHIDTPTVRRTSRYLDEEE